MSVNVDIFLFVGCSLRRLNQGCLRAFQRGGKRSSAVSRTFGKKKENVFMNLP